MFILFYLLENLTYDLFKSVALHGSMRNGVGVAGWILPVLPRASGHSLIKREKKKKKKDNT